jgi:two-component system response regulator (stage 0 sporulation protein F)
MKPFTGKKALVVDDEATTRMLLSEALKSLGMEVTEAVDGADAIHKSLQTRFDLATMDIMMPNIGGLDAIRAMRMVDPAYRIIVVSSVKDEQCHEAVRELGVPHFVSKPIRLAELRAAVKATLADEQAVGS